MYCAYTHVDKLNLRIFLFGFIITNYSYIRKYPTVFFLHFTVTNEDWT